jgi:hypothetical protein
MDVDQTGSSDKPHLFGERIAERGWNCKRDGCVAVESCWSARHCVVGHKRHTESRFH